LQGPAERRIAQCFAVRKYKQSKIILQLTLVSFPRVYRILRTYPKSDICNYIFSRGKHSLQGSAERRIAPHFAVRKCKTRQGGRGFVAGSVHRRT